MQSLYFTGFLLQDTLNSSCTTADISSIEQYYDDDMWRLGLITVNSQKEANPGLVKMLDV